MNVFNVVNAAVAVIEQMVVAGIVRVYGPEFKLEVVVFTEERVKR